MKIVLGRLNAVTLDELATEGCAICSRVDAAVAFADGSEHRLLDECKSTGKILKYIGRLDGVRPDFLRELLASGSLAEARLVWKGFHAKVIWWRDFGAYVGSANLTARAWDTNVEAGIFVSEEELQHGGGAGELLRMFEHLDATSFSVDVAVIERLESLGQSAEEDADLDRRGKRRARLDELFPEPPPPPPSPPPMDVAPVETALSGAPAELRVEVAFHAAVTSSGKLQIWLTVSNSDGDPLSRFLGATEAKGGALVKWDGGSLSAPTFKVYSPNQWKLTVSSKFDDARPLYEFAQDNLCTQFRAVVRRTEGQVTLTLAIKVP